MDNSAIDLTRATAMESQWNPKWRNFYYCCSFFLHFPVIIHFLSASLYFYPPPSFHLLLYRAYHSPFVLLSIFPLAVYILSSHPYLSHRASLSQPPNGIFRPSPEGRRRLHSTAQETPNSQDRSVPIHTVIRVKYPRQSAVANLSFLRKAQERPSLGQ